jgi:integrase/recombinase XerC
MLSHGKERITMKYSDAIADFKSYGEHEKGYSPRTMKCYLARVRHFGKWLDTRGLGDPEIHTLTLPTVRSYVHSIRARPRTVRTAIGTLRTFFGYFAESGAMEDNPALSIKMPKKDAAERHLISDEDLEALLDGVSRNPSAFGAARDTAVLSVLIYTGIRRSELLSLEVDHISLNDERLLVQQGKGKKSREVPLCEEAVAALAAWLTIRKGLRCDHNFLFTVDRKRRLYQNGLNSLMRRAKALAGLRDDQSIHLHSIRHAMALRLYENGATITAIQNFLGHTDPTTTLQYLRFRERDLHAAKDLVRFAGNRQAPVVQAEPVRSRRVDATRRHRRERSR